MIMTMKALVLNRYNGPLELTELSMPKVEAGQVLVRVKASGLNPLDTKIRAGNAAHAKHPLPLVLGIDMAGTVEALGEGVTRFKVGDEVYGMTGGVGGLQGSLAEFQAVDARLIARKPSNLTMKEAAAVPLGFITSYQGIVDRANLKSGQTVLVQGGAGGVGHLSVQLAVALGARVFTTVGEKDLPVAEQYGATAIDYRKYSVEEYVDEFTGGQGFDLVADTVGGATLDASFKAVKQFGHVVSALGWGTHALAPLSFKEATYSGVFTLSALLNGKHREHYGEMLDIATELIESGKLLPKLDRRSFDLSNVEDGYKAIVEATNAGKVVVEIK
jgi:NADPH:quinone reductase